MYYYYYYYYYITNYKLFSLKLLRAFYTGAEMDAASPVMSDEHKQLLCKFRLILVDNMEPDDVVNHLQSRPRRTLTDRHMTDIKSESGREQQVECLLDRLYRRPDYAFNNLVEALEATSQEHLAWLFCDSSGKHSGLSNTCKLCNFRLTNVEHSPSEPPIFLRLQF